MLKIGIVGAENSHCAEIAKLCNVEKQVDARVEFVWGETEAFAKAAAEAGKIPTIVRDWKEMAGKVDGIMIDHRDGQYHAEVATFFINKGIPCFVDKPFTASLAVGRKLCALARRKKVAITSFSTIRLQKSYFEFKEALKSIGTVAAVGTMGPMDVFSQYSGVYFYGIHHAEAVVEALGTNVDSVFVQSHEKSCVLNFFYKDGPFATSMGFNNGNYTFHWSAYGDKGVLAVKNLNDPNHYTTGCKMMVDMFATGKEPLSHERILAPIAILDAMAKSFKTGKRVKVKPVTL